MTNSNASDVFPPKDYDLGVVKPKTWRLYVYADVCGKYLGGGLLRDTAGSRNTGSGRRVTYTHGVDIAARCWGIFWRGGDLYVTEDGWETLDAVGGVDLMKMYWQNPCLKQITS